jgi:FtsP/CotA-like multicopper oxidase with cupredoxin domain
MHALRMLLRQPVTKSFGVIALITVCSVQSSPAAVPQVARLTAQSSKAGCRQLQLYAEKLPKSPEGQIRLGYGLTPDTASIPGPTIELVVGQCLDIRLFNDIPKSTLRQLKTQYNGDPDLPLAVSIHPHGVKYDRASDGTVDSDSYVLPGKSRVFTWFASNISAGYWWYHDHVVGTHHGTGGMASGLFAGLIVRERDDPRPDVPTFVVAMGDNATINLQHFPDTPVFTAREGQHVEFLVFVWGNSIHTFHLHGHTWADNRTGVFDKFGDTRAVDDRVVGPGDSFGFQVKAGQYVGPNNWLYHCHVQAHSDQGMFGYFQVLPASSA